MTNPTKISTDKRTGLTAEETYNNNQDRARQAWNRISQAMADEANDGTEKHWGHAGSAGEIARLLEEAADFITGEGEYA